MKMMAHEYYSNTGRKIESKACFLLNMESKLIIWLKSCIVTALGFITKDKVIITVILHEKFTKNVSPPSVGLNVLYTAALSSRGIFHCSSQLKAL